MNKEGTTQINFILANLRMNLHSKNINLSRIIGDLKTEKLNQAQFFELLTFIHKEMTQ